MILNSLKKRISKRVETLKVRAQCEHEVKNVQRLASGFIYLKVFQLYCLLRQFSHIFRDEIESFSQYFLIYKKFFEPKFRKPLKFSNKSSSYFLFEQLSADIYVKIETPVIKFNRKQVSFCVQLNHLIIVSVKNRIMSSKKLKIPRRTNLLEEVNGENAASFVGSVRRNFKSILFVSLLACFSYFLPEIVQLKSILVVNNALVAENSRKIRYWNVCFATWNENGNLRTMNRVFDRLGYEYVNASHGYEWDVLWSFEYPFDYEGRSELYDPIFNKPLKPHQRINHIPGISVITNKSYMTTQNRDLHFIMPTYHFELKEEFKEYVAKNPERKFVEKSYTNRGVHIIEKDKIDFNRPNTLYQAFMEKPFLVDGHAFDMGICKLINHSLMYAKGTFSPSFQTF